MQTCICCKVKFGSLVLQREHFKTPWHSYNLKRKICGLDTIDLESFNKIVANAPVQIKEPQNSNQEHDLDDDEGDDADWEDVEDDSAYEEELLARVIKPESCFFCDTKSTNINSNIEHMNLLHGFFIPEERYLIDLEGLMEYLGFKIGAGGICIWCDKQFNSVHGVRLHMISKDHCKIFYDHEKAINEFKEYYDYSTQEHIDMKPLNQLVLLKKKRYIQKRTHYHSENPGKQLVTFRQKLDLKAGTSLAKSAKIFNEYRRKIFLRTGMANNYTMRSRLRLQNPV